MIQADAIEGYRLCLQQKRSMKSLLRLLKFYSDEGNIQATLSFGAQILGILDREYKDNLVRKFNCGYLNYLNFSKFDVDLSPISRIVAFFHTY